MTAPRALSVACAMAVIAAPGDRIDFRDVQPASGIDFVLNHHPTPEKHLIETMPGGIAVFDYDGDGLTDIFFTNGAAIPSLQKESAKYWNRLYRNEGKMRFRDVTERTGLKGRGYSMGAAVADYDNDGDVDLFVAGVRDNILYRNDKGKFEDVTQKSGIRSDEWAVAAGWFDYDNDGLLDLFVVNYLDWSLSFDTYCGDRSAGVRVYCHPRLFRPVPNALYRNRGDGTFEDVSVTSGIARHTGKGMSLAFGDYDSDGRLDVYVTNDHMPNFLFRNLGSGKFEETGIASGAGLLDTGKAVSSMGTDFRDYDNDGLPDIVVTALSGETFPLFRNIGNGAFADATYGTGLARLSHVYSGWGVGFIDVDNNGLKDVVTANSHVNDRVEQFEATTYKMRNAVFLNAGNGKFSEAIAFGEPRAHRGCAFADFNQDGAIDLVTTSLGDSAELWQNKPAGNHWLVLKLIGTRSNRDGIGARVRIGNQENIFSTAVGYASSSHAGVHFGLGSAVHAPKIEILWPSGVRQVLQDVVTDRVIPVREPASGHD